MERTKEQQERINRLWDRACEFPNCTSNALEVLLYREFDEWQCGKHGAELIGGTGYYSDDVAAFFGIPIDDAEFIFCMDNVGYLDMEYVSL